jgi:hypothetical protein
MNQFINCKVVIHIITKSLIILGGSMAQKQRSKSLMATKDEG